MEIYRELVNQAKSGNPLAMGIVIEAVGSTPQKAGSKALVDGAQNQWGTLGGGMVEADGFRRMSEILESGGVDTYEYRLDEDYSRQAGPICGGLMRFFLIRPTAEEIAVYEKALNAFAQRQRGVLATVLSESFDGTRIFWYSEEAIKNQSVDELFSSSVDELGDCIKLDHAMNITVANEYEVYLEPTSAHPRLLVVGGGHVGQAVAVQADLLGFEVHVFDDREEYASPSLFPAGTTTKHGNLKELMTAFPKDRDTYIVLVSKGHRPDAEALEGCIHSDLRYLGMIGSRRKIRFLHKHFIEEGLCSEAEWDRIHTPIGYDFGAVSVPEIGVSIAAQLIASRRKPATLEQARSLTISFQDDTRES
jgi:xanthine dehydrogenase accessory factor